MLNPNGFDAEEDYWRKVDMIVKRMDLYGNSDYGSDTTLQPLTPEQWDRVNPVMGRKRTKPFLTAKDIVLLRDMKVGLC